MGGERGGWREDETGGKGWRVGKNENAMESGSCVNILHHQMIHQLIFF